MKAIALALIASPAAAQDICGDRDTMIANMASKYGETAHSAGVAPLFDGSGVLIVENFVNSETGTWTLIVTGPDGRTCVLAIGNRFRLIPAGDPV